MLFKLLGNRLLLFGPEAQLCVPWAAAGKAGEMDTLVPADLASPAQCCQRRLGFSAWLPFFSVWLLSFCLLLSL